MKINPIENQDNSFAKIEYLLCYHMQQVTTTFAIEKIDMKEERKFCGKKKKSTI